MKTLTFVSMFLLAVSGATAQSITVISFDTAATARFQTHADVPVSRICMRCMFGG